MELSLLLSLVVFSFVSTVTPGPNNLMLMSSGANYGFRRTVPHMLGIGIGFSVMVFLVGILLMNIFDRVPTLRVAMKIAATAYMLWLAWRIAQASAPETGETKGRPFTFLEAASFQWINPKAWAMATTAITFYAPDRSLLAVIIVAIIFALVNIPSVSIWTVLGQEIRQFLGTPRRLRSFNWTMAFLLVASLYPILKG